MSENNQNGAGRRRSTRILIRIPLIINAVRGPEDSPWERVETVTLSKHGGMVRARESYSVGDHLEIHIREKGRSAKARVVWTTSRITDNDVALGFEIVDDQEFWEMDFPADRYAGRGEPKHENP